MLLLASRLLLPTGTTDRTKRTREDEPEPLLAAAAAAADVQAPKAARISSASDPADVPLKELDALPTAATADQNGSAAAAKHQPAAAAVVDEHQQQQPDYRPGDCIVQVGSQTCSVWPQQLLSKDCYGVIAAAAVVLCRSIKALLHPVASMRTVWIMQ